jgi:hypothetical protein
MNTDERCPVFAEIAPGKYNELFAGIECSVADDAELAVVSRQARLGHALNCSRIEKPT